MDFHIYIHILRQQQHVLCSVNYHSPRNTGHKWLPLDPMAEIYLQILVRLSQKSNKIKACVVARPPQALTETLPQNEKLKMKVEDAAQWQNMCGVQEASTFYSSSIYFLTKYVSEEERPLAISDSLEHFNKPSLFEKWDSLVLFYVL